MNSAIVRPACASLLALTALFAQSGPLRAEVVAGNANYTYPLNSSAGEMVNITLNVLENLDSEGGALVSGSPRPLQLIDVTSNDPNVMVTRFRNCITASFLSPGPTTFALTYTMADGTNPFQPNSDVGNITFVGSSTQSYATPEDPSCGDPEFNPAAVIDAAQTQANQSVLIAVLDNDSPVLAVNSHVVFASGSGDNDVFQITTMNGGTALAQPNGEIVYTPAAGFTGTDTFSYIFEAYSRPGFEGLNPMAAVGITVLPNEQSPSQPLSNAELRVNGGTTTSIADTNQQAGETVMFTVVETVAGELADIVTYEWFVGEESVPRQSNPNPQFTVTLPDGASLVRVVATDTNSMSGSLSTLLTIAAAPTSPSQSLANAELRVNGGTITTIADSNQQPGETVVFSVNETIPGELADIVTFAWFVGTEPAPRQSSPSPQFTVALSDGASFVRVVATDTSNMSGSLSTSVTIAAAPTTSPPEVLANAELQVNGNVGTAIVDSDQKPGETVLFAVIEKVAGGLADISNYDWFVGTESVPRQSGASPQFSVALPDGSSMVRVVAKNTQNMTGTRSTFVAIAAPLQSPPQNLVNAEFRVNGATSTAVNDSDQKPGETVAFAVVETVAGALADIVLYEWFVGTEPTPRQSGPSPEFTVALPDGVSFIKLRATNTNSVAGGLMIPVTIAAVPTSGPQNLANAELRVNGGTATSIADSDQQAGEAVVFSVIETVAGELADIVNYEWFVGDDSVSRQSSPSNQFTVALPDGVSFVKVVATDANSMTGVLGTSVTVAATTTPQPTPPQPDPTPEPPPAPTPMPPLVDAKILVNGGTATSLADSDLKAGETVLFAVSVSDSTSANLADINFDWFVGKETAARQSGPSPSFSVALPDGASLITLVGKGPLGTSRSVSITVTIGAAPQMLSDMPGLQPNQMGVAGALDRMCRDTTTPDTSSLTQDQLDALARCQAIARADPADQMRALDELSGMDFNGSRTQTLLFTKSTYSGVSDRMGALRGGARGVSLRGLNLIIDGKAIPLAELQNFVGKLLGGGASADEPGSLLGDKWGFWTRGNMTLGSKSASGADRGFKANQFSLVSGLDYRISNDSVLGAAVSFGASNVAYNPIGEGGLDTKTWAVNFYGTTYAVKRGYLDVAVNVADASYASHRRINYTDNLGFVDRDARGKTDGLTWSAGLSGGYDLVFKGLSISPNGSVFFTDSGIDGFRERGAGGLDLAYEDQNFESLTGTAGLRINYALRLPFGVVLPYLRADYVRELESKVAVFNVRFANEIDNGADPIAVQSDTPDKSYWRLSSGMSAQLPFGLSGYIEYQRLESLQFVSFQDFAFGLRMQARF